MGQEKAHEAVGTFLDIGALTLCLKSLGSVGVDGGDPIDNTCLLNTLWVTKQPQSLQEVPDIPFTCAYHPDSWAAVLVELNKNQLITIKFKDTSKLSFWGYLRSYEPKEAAKGEEWQATGTVVVTNINGSAVETGPTYTAP